MTATVVRWAARWQPKGERPHFMCENGNFALFPTKQAARDWIVSHYGYILLRPELRRKPHNWRMPRPIKVAVTIDSI